MTVQELIQQWGQGEGRLLNSEESKQLLQAAGLPVSDEGSVRAPADARLTAEQRSRQSTLDTFLRLHAVEICITVEQDPVLGPVMAVGFGRMAMEIWEDVAYRVIPLAKKDAGPMLMELKGARRLFAGYRQMEAVNASQVESLLLAVSDFVARTPQVHALELSPVYGTRASVAIHDARIELRASKAQPLTA